MGGVEKVSSVLSAITLMCTHTYRIADGYKIHIVRILVHKVYAMTAKLTDSQTKAVRLALPSSEAYESLVVLDELWKTAFLVCAYRATECSRQQLQTETGNFEVCVGIIIITTDLV